MTASCIPALSSKILFSKSLTPNVSKIFPFKNYYKYGSHVLTEILLCIVTKGQP